MKRSRTLASTRPFTKHLYRDKLAQNSTIPCFYYALGCAYATHRRQNLQLRSTPASASTLLGTQGACLEVCSGACNHSTRPSSQASSPDSAPVSPHGGSQSKKGIPQWPTLVQPLADGESQCPILCQRPCAAMRRERRERRFKKPAPPAQLNSCPRNRSHTYKYCFLYLCLWSAVQSG